MRWSVAPWPRRRNESSPVKASFVFTSIVTMLSRLNLSVVSTVNEREVPDGIGPPAPVNTSRTPRSWASADSAGALFASSAMAATGWLAIPPTLHTSAFFEWTTKSGGESGCEPGTPGPAGVRFSIVTRQVLVSPPPAPAPAVRSAVAASARPVSSRKRFMLSPPVSWRRDRTPPRLRDPFRSLTEGLIPAREADPAAGHRHQPIAYECLNDFAD